MTIAELLEELGREAGTTRRVLERVPEEGLDWRPHEKSRTLGELAMHLATLPGAIAEISLRPSFNVKGPVASPGAASTAELVAVYDESVARAQALLGAMDDSALATPWRLVDGERVLLEIPRSVVLRSIMLNHSYHHRGQLILYLRLLGAPVPAVYGPSADEDPFAA
ncbi:MAG TPA: DinB family protein [Longimicrobiaceae bacterium]|nr:DinB family protein [Longimicrobiaceae bacterium]